MSLFRRDPADPDRSGPSGRTSAPSIEQVRSELARRRFRSAERRETDHNSERSVPPGGYRRPVGAAPARLGEPRRDDRLGEHEREVRSSATEAPAAVESTTIGVPTRDPRARTDAAASTAKMRLVQEPSDAAPARRDGPSAEWKLPENVSATDRHDAQPVGGDASTTAMATLKRTYREFKADNLTDLAASLTYYGLMSLFPALIAFVSILGIFGDPVTTTRTLTDIVGRLAPGTASQTFQGPIQSIIEHKSAAGILFFVGIAVALWSASGYIGAFMRAANKIYETPEGRPFWKLRPLQLGVTFVMVILLVAVVLALVFTGPVVDAVAGPIGIGSTAVQVWNIAKWPVLVVVVLSMISVLYYASPNVRIPRFRLITPGAVLALGLWVVASVAFAFYVANFGSYDKTYGTLGGVISLLVWLWISNIALLLGAELNAEIERTRELRGGVVEAAREIQLDAREAPKPPATP